MQQTISSPVYLAYATILDDEPLRAEEDGKTPCSLYDEASCEGICYLQVLHSIADRSMFRVHVAASLALLATQPIPIFLTEAQLDYAVTSGCQMAKKHSMSDPANIPNRPSSHDPVPPTFSQPAKEEEDLLALVPIFVSKERVQKTVHSMDDMLEANDCTNSQENPSHMQDRLHSYFWREWILLKAALSSVSLRWAAMAQTLRTLFALFSRSHQRFLNTEEVHECGHLVGWWVTVGVPPQLLIPSKLILRS